MHNFVALRASIQSKWRGCHGSTAGQASSANRHDSGQFHFGETATAVDTFRRGDISPAFCPLSES
jgi:hypothetical protein